MPAPVGRIPVSFRRPEGSERVVGVVERAPADAVGLDEPAPCTCPFLRRAGEVRRPGGVAHLERLATCSGQFGGRRHRKHVGDHEHVVEVLGATVDLVLEPACVGVELLRQVLGGPDDRHHDGLESGELEDVGQRDRLGRAGVVGHQVDVEAEGLEHPSVESRHDGGSGARPPRLRPSADGPGRSRSGTSRPGRSRRRPPAWPAVRQHPPATWHPRRGWPGHDRPCGRRGRGRPSGSTSARARRRRAGPAVVGRRPPCAAGREVGRWP